MRASTMMSLCQSIDTLSMAYLDDELADEELRDFEMHLIECAACRARVDGEREALGELRRQLAAPAMPDVARARLRAALDREDEQAAREERRGRLGAWLLPGAASVAAVAALALFVVSRAPTEAPSAPAPIEMVKNSPRSFQVPAVAGLQPVALDGPGQHGPAVYRVATWRERPRGVDVAGQAFVVRTSGGEFGLQTRVFDARKWDIEFGDPFVAHGKRMWFVSGDGHYAVVHKSRDGVGYILTSDELAPRELVDAVSRIDFVRIADARLR